LNLAEPKGWTCCGATAGHQTDRLLAVSLPAANLTKVQDMKLDMVVNCGRLLQPVARCLGVGYHLLAQARKSSKAWRSSRTREACEDSAAP